MVGPTHFIVDIIYVLKSPPYKPVIVSLNEVGNFK